jgi:hypothetical protein
MMDGSKAILRGLVLLLGAALVGCGGDDDDTTPAAAGSGSSPALYVEIASELAVPADIDVLELSVAKGNDVLFDRTYDLAADARLPATIALTVAGGKVAEGTLSPGVVPLDAAPGDPLVVMVRARLGSTGDWRVMRAARVALPGKDARLLVIPLRRACGDILCAEGQTCLGGSCATADVDVSALPAYSADQGDPTKAPLCFDASTCLASRTELDLGTIGSGCKAPVEEGHNLLFLWKGAAEPTVVDADLIEGWDPASKSLAPGLCQAVAMGRVEKAWDAAGCPAKKPEQMLCQ